MKKNSLILVFAALLMLVSFAGCDSISAFFSNNSADNTSAEDTASAASPAKPAAEAPKPAAKPADVSAPKKPTDIKSALAEASRILAEFNDVAKNTGDNCSKFGKEIVDSFDKNKDNLEASLKIINNMDLTSENGAAYKSEVDAIDAAMGDDSDIDRIMKKCNEEPNAKVFAFKFLSVLMNSAPQKEDSNK